MPNPSKTKRSTKLPSSTQLALYRALLKPRIIEERMLLLLRQGKVSKWFSGIGQEAISVGATMALETDDYILPLHRNLGVFTTREIPLERLFAQFQGLENGFTKGRDRSFHFGTNEYHIVGMISHLGPQLCVADGIALADKIQKRPRVTLAFSGDGGTSQGDFHEALNVAAVWQLPVIFVVENNGYGLSTPSSEQFACKQLAEKAAGYGMEGITIDGNDIEEVYLTVSRLAKELRKKPRPVLLECLTFRVRGHEEASGTKYVPKKLLDHWIKRDPIAQFEASLLKRKVCTKAQIEKIRLEIKSEVQQTVEAAFDLPSVTADTAKELGDVFRPHDTKVIPPRKSKTKKRFVDAISDALDLAMEKDDRLILMGQDIAEYGGVFKITEGFVEKFGKDRVRNTPLCESAILGAALGLTIGGMKSVVEMQFADFVSMGFNQVINNLAKSHYRWGQNADVVVRMPTGAGTGAGPFHSQSNEAWFTHTPGLKVVYPAFPFDAKGLLLAAIEDPNPVLYFEHKLLYRSKDQEIPDGYYTIPIGRAQRVREGADLTIITYGLGVHWALEMLDQHPDISALLLDLRTLAPLDYEAIESAVRTTGKVLVLHEDTLTGGFGGEIAAWISEHCFESLDAPVVRCASLDSPVPFASALEQNFLAKSRLEALLVKLWQY